MSTELATTTDRPVTDHVPPLGLTAGQVKLIREQLLQPKNRQATDDELALFLARCDRTGLDPIDNQIYGIYRYDKKLGAEKLTIQTSVEGLRLIAHRTGQYVGSDRAWCAADGQWRDVWLDLDPPAAARATVRKLMHDGQIVEQRAVVGWHEADGSKDNASHFWRDQPAHMLAKTAEARALKIAFPAELGRATTTETDHHPGPAAGGQLAPGTTTPPWAEPATKDQWAAGGAAFKALCNQLGLNADQAIEGWQQLVAPFDGAKPAGLARALDQALPVLLIHTPPHPKTDPKTDPGDEKT